MALASGTRIGVYEIVAPIGAGGMGEVYRARDSQLKRDVALKTLPEGVALDPERLARFQREAEVLASLNHPHIAQIHGLAEGGQVRALVMELIEGDDLAARIASGGALPIDEALAFARQIVLALDYAHERGIIHRDLKPANIKVTADGVVKVLDFGLAKAIDQGSGIGDQGSGGAANSPTLTSPAMTQRGVILGTAAYMSPEQAKGKIVDKRSDIWAFGCVLFEMLAGSRTFDGEDVTDSIVAVMSREPSWQSLPASTPASIRKLLRRCLEKDRGKRLADIRDALFELDEQSSDVPTPQGVTPVTSRLKWAAAGATIAAVVAVAIMTIGFPRNRVATTLDVAIVHDDGWDVGSPHISPDGTRVAYRARGADGLPMIWIRNLTTGESQGLAGTEDGWRPFWSSDGHDIGFYSNFSLKRVPAAGGPVQVITSGFSGQNSPFGADWSGDTILFAPSDYMGLLSVPASGGQPTAATKLAGPDWAHLSPSFLPDGKHFLFTAKLWTRAADRSEQGIYLGSLGSPDTRRLLPDLSSAVYAPPGYLVFLRNKLLHAVRFDAVTGLVTGEPTAISTIDVAWDSMSYTAGISAARDTGTLAVRPSPADLLGRVADAVQMQWIDRAGARTSLGEARRYDGNSRISPDGSRIAVDVIGADGTTDLVSIDSKSGIATPITNNHGFAGWPVWSADSKRLLLDIQPAGGLDDVYVKDLVSGAITPLIESRDLLEQPIAWSSNGDFAIISLTKGSERTMQLFSLRTKQMQELSKFPPGAIAAMSPDDRYLAFSSPESGRFEVYVTTLPDRRQTWQLTSYGARVLSWRRDGREIAVATTDGEVRAYPVELSGTGFSAGAPVTLVRGLGNAAWVSNLTADHSRILTRTDSNAARDRGEIRLLFGWQRRLPQ